jgi:hypothetical protein
MDHQGAVEPVHGQQREHRVIGPEGQQGAGSRRHGSSPAPARPAPWLVLGAGEAVAIGLVLAPDARTHLAPYLLLFASGSFIALFAAQSLSGSSRAFLLLCGAALRLTLLAGSPGLSDDVRRYEWDARVAAAGISPYAYAPSDARLAGVAPELSAGLSHADVRTVYPPVAQAAFRAGLLLGGDRGIRAVFAAADLSIVALLFGLGGPGAGFAAALYAFHPLAITASAGEGHLDSLGVALLLACLVFAGRDRRARSGVAFALSILTKYVPVSAALPLARRGRLAFAAAALATGAALWGAATREGVTPVGGLGDYATRWEFNSVAYPALAGLFERTGAAGHAKAVFETLKAWLGHPAWAQSVYPFFYAGFLARAALAVALAAALLAIGLRVTDTEGAVFASLAVLLLASPTLHPWYLLWVLPFAARRRDPAFLYLSFVVVLSYALIHPVPWLPRPLVYALEYVPFALLLARSSRAGPA